VSIVLGTAALVLALTGCGGGRPHRMLSARQVVSALRVHGIRARITWRANEISGAAAMNGFLGLSGVRLREHWGVTAFVQASFDPLNVPANGVGPPYVDAVVTDTAQQAQGLAHRAPIGSNGRTFNIANVILQVYRSAVPHIAPAVHDLRREARARSGGAWASLHLRGHSGMLARRGL
jgi:hypothetical protein